MKLNHTYPLREMLDALNNASDTIRERVEFMKKNDCFSCIMTCYDREGMISSSPYARVTLTRKVDENTWAGYMEETMGTDGPRTNVKVKRVEYHLVANDDYSNVTLDKPI